MISRCERKMYIDEELNSSMIKMFIVQYMNIGLLVILLYMRIKVELPEELPILKGKYQKFDT